MAAQGSNTDAGSTTAVGDIVWARVRGLPWWPGQVMDPATAQPAALKGRKPDSLLVSFFGDGSHGWIPPQFLEPLELDFREKSRQKTTHKVRRPSCGCCFAGILPGDLMTAGPGHPVGIEQRTPLQPGGCGAVLDWQSAPVHQRQ